MSINYYSLRNLQGRTPRSYNLGALKFEFYLENTHILISIANVQNNYYEEHNLSEIIFIFILNICIIYFRIDLLNLV